MALDYVAGCIGGCAGVLVGHPFDTIKVRLQCQDFRNPMYTSGIDCFKTIIKNESIAGLFRGITSPMAGVAFINAMIFGVQAQIQRNLPNPNSLKSHFISGCAAGFAQSVICSPMELIKTQMQIQKKQVFKGPWECMAHVYKTYGIRHGVFRGLNATLLREGPAFGLYFLVYEMLTRTNDGHPITTFHMLMAGGTAGSASWLLAYPVDVVKSRYQVDGMHGARMYKSATDCAIKSVKLEGIRCMFRGLCLTVVRAFPVNAATWAAVTWTFRLVNPTTNTLKMPDFQLNTSLALQVIDNDLMSRSPRVANATCESDITYFQQFTTQLIRTISTPFF